MYAVFGTDASSRVGRYRQSPFLVRNLLPKPTGTKKELTGAQRLDLARTLHFDYRSYNGQIRRLLNLSQYEVDSLFPARK